MSISLAASDRQIITRLASSLPTGSEERRAVLALLSPKILPYSLELVSGSRVAREFATQDSLNEYLTDHPNADPKKHSVKKKDHKHAPGKGLFDKLKEHAQHVLFDDISEVWHESKEAYEDIVKAVKPTKKNRRNIIQGFQEANEATKSFFSNRDFRRKAMKTFGKSVKKAAKNIAGRIKHAIQAEAHEAWSGVKALGQVLTPGSPPLDKGQKKSLYGLGGYVVGAALAASGGGALMAGAAVAKSFSLHVGVKAVSHLADSLLNHYEWVAEGSHALHGVGHGLSHAFHGLGNALSHIAAEKEDASEELIEAMVLSVAKVLDDGMSDDDVKRMLSGKDDDEYDDAGEIPALDKLKEKADKQSKPEKSEKPEGKKEKKSSVRKVMSKTLRFHQEVQTMSRSLTSSDRSSLIRLASSLPIGSEERRAILAGLSRNAAEDANVPGKHILEKAKVSGRALVFGNAQVGGNATVSDNAKVGGDAQVFDMADVRGKAQVFGKAKVYDNATIADAAVVRDYAKVWGNATVSDNAKVRDFAVVWGSAQVRDFAVVGGSADVSGKALVSGKAVVRGEANVFGKAKVFAEAQVWGNAVVRDFAQVSGNAKVLEKAQVLGGANVFDKAKVYGNAQVWGDAQVGGNARVFGNAQVWGDAQVGGNAVVRGDAIILGGTWDGSEGEILSGKWKAPGIPA